MALSTKNGIVISLCALASLGVTYLMLEAHERERHAELQALEARLLARIDTALQAAAASAELREPSQPSAALALVAPAQATPDAAPEPALRIATQHAVPAAPTHPLLGAWRCAFRSGEYAYPPMACQVRRTGAGYTLEKTQGSQRIKGAMTLEGDARFVFSGLFFCPHGACDAQVHGVFTRKSREQWVGTLQGMESGDVVVTMTR
jgi:hypothetical protein